MLGSTMLEVAIGMAFIYTVLSLVCTAAREAVEAWTRSRSADLERGIRQLLAGEVRAGGVGRWIKEAVAGHSLEMGAASDTTVAQFYRHPLILSLYAGTAGPSYIPTRHFVAALLDLAVRETNGQTQITSLTLPDVVGAARNNTALPAALREVIEALALQAGGDLERFKALVGDWFDGTMDRVAGWYKRRTQAILFVIGFAVAVLANADSIRMGDTLARNQSMRASLASAAEAYAALPENRPGPRQAQPADPPADGIPAGPDDPAAKGAASAPAGGAGGAAEALRGAVAHLQEFGLPIGWRDCSDAEWNPPPLDPSCSPGSIVAWWQGHSAGAKGNLSFSTWLGRWWEQLQSHFFGWLLTALALTLGAPFWFDVLNKIMVIRSTVKPREKSQEEGSEDRRAIPAPTLTLNVQGTGTP